MQKRAVNARFCNFIRFYLRFRSDGNREAVPFPPGGRTARTCSARLAYNPIRVQGTEPSSSCCMP